MRRRIVRILAAGIAVGAIAVTSASAGTKAARSSPFLVGINDEAFTLYGDPPTAFSTLQSLRAQVIRVNLYWGGPKWAVANKKPRQPANPGDPAYKWTLYDRLVRYAADSDIKVVFSILFTPRWANHGKAQNRAPTSFAALQTFAHAAALRYDGKYTPPTAQQDPTLGTGPLPRVSFWTAWNEPNNPVFLSPQYLRVGRTWRVESAYNYARICNAVYAGIHSVKNGTEKVACGVTDPKGNDNARSSRPSVDPLSFLAAAHRYGMKRFDVYAHHPYATAGNESPRYVPRGRAKRRAQLGNISVLLREISRYYGPKHLWITEYGYQTNPPDHTIEGTSWAKQALYLKQAFAIARANPRIDMMLWFLVRDQPQISGWQSGLETINDVHKPAWAAFAELPH